MTGVLKGKRLVVIGGTTGLGFSAALAFVHEGARVVVVGRNPHNVAKAIKRLGRNALGLAADATVPETSSRAIAMLVEPLEASMTRSPGFRAPRKSASSRM